MNATSGSKIVMSCLPLLWWLDNPVTKLPWRKTVKESHPTITTNNHNDITRLPRIHNCVKCRLHARDKRVKTKLCSGKSNGSGLLIPRFCLICDLVILRILSIYRIIIKLKEWQKKKSQFVSSGNCENKIIFTMLKPFQRMTWNIYLKYK